MKSAQAFFSSILDFAGVFPPASLTVQTAIDAYSTYQKHPARWVLANFLATASHLEQLAKLGALPVDSKLGLLIVSRKLEQDLSSINNSLSKLSSKVALRGVEISLDITAPPLEQIETIELALGSVEEERDQTKLFLEIPSCQNWDSILPEILDAACERASLSGRQIGFKLRCGGDPSLIPPPNRVARVLRECAARNLPIKFTAGLHQPFRSQHSPAHGFFNIFFAALVANRSETSEAALTGILSEYTSCDPIFKQTGIEWLGITLSCTEITELRTTRVLSFGSCSFLEPVEESTKRGWF
jgi:hypothetical protein